MSNDLITRLVVGEPTKICLGKPVGQRLHSGHENPALRWKEVTSVGRTPRLPSLFRRTPPKTFKLPTRRLAAVVPGRRTAWTVAAVVLVALGAGVGVLWRAPNSGFLPIAPAGQQDHGQAQAVKILSAPYTPHQQETTTSAAATSLMPIPGLPIAAADSGPENASSGPIQVSAAATAAAMPSPARTAEKPPGKKEQPANQQQKPPAVVLDEVAPQRPAPAPQIVAKATPAAKPDAPAKAPPAAAPRGTGLVAITPDGKSAVFTNPKTRLPEQFKVGDLLPGGETIRSIDNNSGKVLTSSKEYHLD